MSNTTEILRKWLRTCPAISNSDRFNVDFMGHAPNEFALYSSPSTISSFIDITGKVCYRPVQELNFVFVSLFPLSRDVLSNLENIGFFDDLLRWMRDQDRARNYPEIDEGKIISITPTMSPYLFDAGTDSGRYQIQIKVRYRMQ